MKNRLQNYKYYLYILLTIFTSTLYLNACSENATQSDVEIVLPEKDLNFEEHIKPLFINKCANRSGCHAPFEPAKGLNLTDYQTIMTHFVLGTEPLVVSGHAEQSFLYNILRGQLLNVPRMPLEQPSLNSNNINGVKIWINEGAEQLP